MPSSIFWGMQHLNSNVLVSIVLEATGPDPNLHSPLEVAVLPLDHMLNPHPELLLFNMRMKCDPDMIDWNHCRVSRADIANTQLRGLDCDKVASLFCRWFESLQLHERKRLLPLAYNWPATRSMLINWLGHDVFTDLFDESYRDVLVAAHFLNDRDCCKAEPVPFAKQSLAWIAKKMNVERPSQKGNTTEDCMTIARVYRALLKM